MALFNCELRISKRFLFLLFRDVLRLLGSCWDIMLKKAKTVTSVTLIIHRSLVYAYRIWHCIISAGKAVSSCNLRTELTDKTEQWKSLSPQFFKYNRKYFCWTCCYLYWFNLSTFSPSWVRGKYIDKKNFLLSAWRHIYGNFNTLHTRAFSCLLPH